MSQQPQPRETKDDASESDGGVPGHSGLFADTVNQDDDGEDDEGEDHCGGEDLCGVVVDDPVRRWPRHFERGEKVALLYYF